MSGLLELDTAIVGARMVGFFGKTWVKLVTIVLAFALMGFVIWQTINTVRTWQENSFKLGYASGSNFTNSAWQKVSADNFQRQRDQAIADANRNNQSVATYLADAAAVQTSIRQTKQEVRRYAQTPAGAARCVDGDGVRILLEGRSALNLGGSTSSAH